jgi:hypothetical protein
MGPRQMTGVFGPLRKPMEMILTPCAMIGTSYRSAVDVGRPSAPIMSAMLGP